MWIPAESLNLESPSRLCSILELVGGIGGISVLVTPDPGYLVIEVVISSGKCNGL